MENGGEGTLDRIVRRREAAREDARRRYTDDSRERLRKNVETKIQTTMIGSLSLIEQFFGDLWGQGKPRDDLTDGEMIISQLKDELRTAILNLGNGQIRAVQKEIAQYDVTWNRYQYDLTPAVGGGEDQQERNI